MGSHLIQRGLALVIDGRHVEVDRLLEKNTVVQVEDVATGVRKSYPVARLQRLVSTGKAQILGDSVNGAKVWKESASPEALPFLLARLTPAQEQALTLRQNYVRAMRRRGLSSAKIARISEAIPEVAAALNDERPPTSSTIRRWMQLYEKGGCNLGALIPRTIMRKRASRTAPEVVDLAWKCLRQYYFTRRGASLKDTCRRFVMECATESKQSKVDSGSFSPMSLTSFRRLSQEVSAYQRDRVREGPTFAAHKWRHAVGGVYATRPLERVEMDHTVLDIYVVDDERWVPLGRPTLTMLVDSFSNYIIALYISFEGESLGRVTKSIRMALTLKDEITSAAVTANEWITPGMWECLVVDNALAFQSPQLQRIAQVFGFSLEFGPVRKPWFKPTVERHMREISRLLPADGKTIPMRGAKDVMDPYKDACIAFSDLWKTIVRWVVDVHPFEVPERSLTRPIDALREGLLQDPAPVLLQDGDTLNFITALEQSITVGPGGVEFKYLAYRSVELGELAKRQSAPVFKTQMRYDPADLGMIWVQDPTHKTWVKVPCLQHEYANGLTLYQHRQIRLYAKEKLKKGGAIEVWMQAKEDLCDLWSQVIKRGKKAMKAARMLANMKGVGSLTGADDVGTSNVPKPKPPRKNDISLVSNEDIPSFDAFDLSSRDGWEAKT